MCAAILPKRRGRSSPANRINGFFLVLFLVLFLEMRVVLIL